MNRVMDCYDSPGDTWLHATQVISDSSNLIVSLCRLSHWIYSNILLSSHWLANHMSCRKGNMLGVKKKMEIFWSLLIMNFVHNSHLTNYTKQRLWLSCGMIWVRANDSYYEDMACATASQLIKLICQDSAVHTISDRLVSWLCVRVCESARPIYLCHRNKNDKKKNAFICTVIQAGAKNSIVFWSQHG